MSVSKKRNTRQPSFRNLRFVLTSRFRFSDSLVLQNSLFFLKALPSSSFFLRPCQKELSQNTKILVPDIRKSGWPGSRGCFLYFIFRLFSSDSMLFSSPVSKLLTRDIRFDTSLEGFPNHGFLAFAFFLESLILLVYMLRIICLSGLKMHSFYKSLHPSFVLGDEIRTNLHNIQLVNS